MLLKNLFEEIARTGKGSTAVVGWGRGMGHKGHMMLASSVITKAKEVSGDPYFVVSRVVGKDDPLTADEKIAIYKKVFPEQGHIFQAASDDIPSLTGVLTNLNQQGYNSVTVVVGADQVKAFQYLKNYNNKPDKSGNIAFNFDNLDIISRQETGDPSAGEEGPRATPMRQILNDPKATPEQQFQVWRDAMSPELSDKEVMDLMNKAKERMGQFAKPKSKTPVAVNELSSELLGRYKKAAGASASAADKAGDFKTGNKRFSGIVKATKKQFANDEKKVAEANPNQQIARYNPDGATYRGMTNKMPTLDPQDPVHNADRFGSEHDRPYDHDDDYDRSELKRVMAKQMSNLKDREQEILKSRYWDNMTYAEIGAELGISAAGVRQIEAKALRKLKHPSRSDPLQAFIEQGVAEGEEIKIPTEDGITMQDIRLMAGEGKLTKKTVLQAIAVIRKQRKEQGVAEGLTTEKQILTRIRQIMYDRKLSGTESNAGELLRLKQQLKDLRSQQGVAEAEKKPHPKTWHDVDKKLGKVVDKMSQAEKVKKGLAHPDTLKKQGVAEGLSKRDLQDVAAIKAAIERLQAQLSHPNADRDAIQQSIAHERKRLALYGVTEDSSKAMAQTAKRLTDPKDGATAKLRAAGDKRREDQLKSRDIAKKNENINISESVDPKVSIVFDKYNPLDKDSIDGWKVAAKTKYWMVGTNKVKKDPKNPLPHEVKLVCLETAMPRINEHLEIVDDWLALAVKAYKKYGDIHLVVCTRHDQFFKQILQKNGHKGEHGYFKFDKITKVATPYFRHDKELKQALINKDKTAFKRASGVSPDKRVVAEHNRYEYFDLLEKFMIKRIPIVSLNESKVIPISESIESQMENLIKRLENK